MKNLIIIFLGLLIMSTPTVFGAENVTIEILQNSNGVYYIAYGDDLIPCVDSYCNFVVENVTNYNNSNMSFELSTEEINRIAQRISLEIPQQQVELNTSVFEAQLGSTREDITDNLRSYMDLTLIPEVARFDEQKNALTAAELEIVTLKAKSESYDVLKTTTDTNAFLLEEKIKSQDTTILILILMVISLVMIYTPNGKAIMISIKTKRGGT